MLNGLSARRAGVLAVWVALSLFGLSNASAAAPADKAAGQYLQLLQNFAGWAEQHWNEQEQCYDAAGKGVSWARGNGAVCLVYAALLTEMPDQSAFSPRRVGREVMRDHVSRTLRTLCLRNKNCTDTAAAKPPTWGGPTWQAALETEHWAVAARLLTNQLDEKTKALVRQVVTAEADAAMKNIPSAKEGDTAADDCCWNAGLLGVTAAIYADDPKAAAWDEWAKRWALNIEARESDRKSDRMIDGKLLREWLVSTNAHPDLTVENHGFWDPPYQVCFAALVEPAMAYRICSKPIPEAFHANIVEEGDSILKWLTLVDGDLLCPQGFDWAERDVQHSWAYTELGTLADLSWARAAEQRCLKLLMRRQAAFGDGALHALDFGYETDLACCWTYSYFLHKYFGKAGVDAEFKEIAGGKIFPYVGVGVYRTPDLVSSVTWFRVRQAVMIVPNNVEALGDDPCFAAYRADAKGGRVSGLGYLKLMGKKAAPPFRIDGEPVVKLGKQGLAVSYRRTIPDVATQRIGYCALPTGEVLVFSRWEAVKDITIAELVDHSFYWVELPGFLPKRTAKAVGKGEWSIDGKLRMQILGGAEGKVEESCLLGSVRQGPFKAKAGEILQDSVCVYQAEIPGRMPISATGGGDRVELGKWMIARAEDGSLSVKSQGS